MIWIWAGFIVFVLAVLLFDLLVINKGDEPVPMRRALGFTAFTIALALSFAVGVYFMYEHHWMGIGLGPDGQPLSSGKKAATDFVQGWLLEYSLSVDNLFVFALVFNHFGVPARYQHRVLFWGILGALIMRAVMIFLGVTLISLFEPVLYLFGAFLIYTALKLLRSEESDFDPEASWLVRGARRVFPVSPSYDGHKFLTVLPDGRRAITPLLLVLLVVEGTDVVFAVDSIPAIFGITRDPFIVFTSNVFAILGLRSLYFALANLMDRFRYLKISLSVILAFVGVKMIIEQKIPAWGYEGVHVPGAVSLGFILLSLAVGVGASWIIPVRHEQADDAPPARPGRDAPAGAQPPETGA